MNVMKKEKTLTLLLLHVMLMVYSLSGVCSKKAASEHFLSRNFCIYYGLVIFLLGVYAIVWQQVIKRIPLTTAYANKAVTIVWGMIWGTLFFSEQITPGKVVGAMIVIFGLILYATSDEEG